MDVVITPEPGRTKEIAQILLTLADHPHQVAYVSWPSHGFRVSKDLFMRFEYFMAGKAETQPEAEDFAVSAPVERKKSRGRPKKVTPENAEEGK